MPYITSEGANLFVEIAGAGTPVFFVHGFGMDHRQWDPQWNALGPGVQSVRMDLRAHGRSAAADGGYSYAATARDVDRVRYQAGIDRLNPGFVVAHSLAADAALQLALSEPRAWRGVVVVTPAIGPTTLARLSECRVPVSVISGRRDRADFRQAAQAIAAAVAGAEFHELDAGAVPNVEQPEAFNTLLRAFMARCVT